MKRATLHHPKLRQLMSAASITRCHALGLLTLLWDFTGQYAANGAIGKFTNAAIAEACDWPVDRADDLIHHLVATGWIDETTDKTVRLIVHHWPEHCEEWVRKRLQREGIQAFIDGSPTWRSKSSSQIVEPDRLDTPSRQNVDPFRQPSPSLAQPSQSHPPPVGGAVEIARRMGMTDKAIKALGDSLHGPALVAAWWVASRDPAVKRLGAVLPHRLASGNGELRMTPEALCAAVKAGHVVMVNGIRAGPDVTKWNKTGLVIGDEVIGIETLEQAKLE